MTGIDNREDALKCVAIARQAMAAGDAARAERFAQKAARLYHCPEVANVLAELAGSGAAESPSSGGTPPPTPPPASASEDAPGTSADSTPRPQRPTASAQGFAPRQRGAGLAGSGLENQGTAEQRTLVGQILKAKDFYEILAIEKTANDEDIKKGYKRLALKLHPDKNKAPRSEDAFKAVSKAFSCLSDPQKRAYYDRTGYESTSAQAAASGVANGGGRGGMRQQQQSDGFDPEEIFNMFFNGGFNPQSRVFRAHFGGGPQRANANGGAAPTAEAAQRNALFNLLQFLPVLLILFFSVFSGFNQPLYSLQQGQNYPSPMVTDRLKVPFFVKDPYDFDKNHPVRSSVRLRLERQVENDYYEKLSARCQQERLAMNRLWTWGRAEEARKLGAPSCAEVERLNAQLTRRGNGPLYGF